MDKKPVRVRIIITDHYLSFEHKLWNGVECEAIPNYTSTKKLKGYIVKSKTRGTDIYMRINEIEILPPHSPNPTNQGE